MIERRKLARRAKSYTAMDPSRETCSAGGTRRHCRAWRCLQARPWVCPISSLQRILSRRPCDAIRHALGAYALHILLQDLGLRKSKTEVGEAIPTKVGMLEVIRSAAMRSIRYIPPLFRSYDEQSLNFSQD